MMGTFDWCQRQLIVTTSRTKRSSDLIAYLQALDLLYGPKPRMPIKPVVIVLDNGPIHVSKATSAALAERAHWLIVEWLPNKGLNSMTSRLSGVDLKAHHLAHQTFTDPDVPRLGHRCGAEFTAKTPSLGQPISA
jgi:hypothetical protein